MLARETTVAAPKRKSGPVRGFWPKMRGLQASMRRHFLARNSEPYERILQYIRAQKDIWITSQGEYISWWQARENASLKITVTDGICRIESSLEQGVIEQFPGKFLDSASIACPEAKFSGEIVFTIDHNLDRKDLLIELLKREGILNYRIGADGAFILRQEEVGSLLEEVESKLRNPGRLFENHIATVRQLVADKLAAYNLPLLRLWYHPRVDGIIPRAVFSPRYDVDRAITNLPHIRSLEMKYNVSSTLYLRAFCPFYGEAEIKDLAAKPWCSELTLHGEFVTNARKYGDEFKAARAERTHLEKLTGRPISGVCMHGGELAYNRSEHTGPAIEAAGFLYDTTPAYLYYFPFRGLINGRLSHAYSLPHTLGDVGMPATWNYGQIFYERTIDKMNQIAAQNGVFVLMMHPIYFGFFRYLSRPKNLLRLTTFLFRLLTGAAKS